MKRKILSLILVFAMTVSLLTVGTGAVEPAYGDTAGHWAESSIERWSGHGIIQGSNGLFDPNGQLTCAQLATILAKLLKLPAAKDAGFTDNTADAWYYDAINRCAAAGILNGNGDGTVTPEAPITRERAMVMLARALGIEPIRKPDLTKYTDAAQVSAYAQGYVAALIEAGIVGGVTADELAPQDNINRASTVTILDRAISTYADKAGATVKADGKGIVLVVADDVTVTGNVDKLLVPADNVDVTVSGSKNIDDITVTGDNSKVILNNSTANDVTLDGKNTELETKSGSKVENVSVTEDAKGATVNAGSGTTVKNVENSAADTTVTGSGSVKNVASDTDVTVETKGTEVKNTGDGKITVTDKNGKDSAVNSGSSSTTTGGTTSGGSSHSHSYVYTDNGDGTHTGRCYANDSTLATEAHKIVDGKCTVCGAAQTAESVASVKKSDGTYAYYLTLAAAINAADAGDTVTLVKDADMTETIRIEGGKKITLALNNHNVSITEQGKFIRVCNAELTVTGPGAVKEMHPYYSPILIKGGPAGSANYSVVNVGSGVTLEGWAGVFIDNNDGNNYGIVLNVNDATLKGVDDVSEDSGSAVYVNGSITNENNMPKITLNNATLEATGAGMYLAGYADTTISGGSIVGAATAIEIRAGKLTLNGGSYTASAAEYACVANSNGATTSGAALAIAQHTTKKNINVMISGGTFNGVKALSESNPQGNTPAPEVTLSITDGTFNGDVTITDKDHTSIAGGTFSTNPDNSYIAAGYVATANTNGTWTVSEKAGVTLVAQVGVNKYESLAAALDAAKDGDTVKLLEDITLTETWTPIGTAEHPFSGTFDGNNKTISNLKITTGNYAGLFGYVSTATIKNVKLANAQVSGGERMASLIGRITDDATVTNCSNDAASSVTGSDSNTGGLIGEIVNGTVELSNLVNNAAVKNTKKSNSRAGGVVAQVTTGANVTLTNCTNNGAVNTNNGYAGGIVSAYQSGTLNIANCVNRGTLVGAYEGNMLGWYTSIRSITISSATNEFDINAIGCIDIATTSDMSLYGKHYFVNKKADLTGVGTTAQTFSEIFAEGKIGTSPRELWDKLIAFYAFAAKTNSNFAGYPKDYWSMFNQSVGYSEPDWDTYFNGYNAKCEAEGRTADKLTKEEFNHATWREKIVYLAP